MKEIEEEIIEKSKYCLNCKLKPCSNKGCPLGNDIPGFIQEIKNGDYKKSFEILSKTTVLSAICGRICPHSKQCEGFCVRGIKSHPENIGELEAFIGDISIEKNYKLNKKDNENKNKKIAVIGGGPSGLTASAFLLMEGYLVTLFEKHDYLGGLLVHGIPEFRLDKKIVENVVGKIIDLGLNVEYGKILGENLELSQLIKDYDAIYIAIGANKGINPKLEGITINGTYNANEILETKKHPNYLNKDVCVIGGGNVAIDIARTVKKMGAKSVKIIYRRSKVEMPAEEKEVLDGINEGIEIIYQANILKILGDKKVEEIELIKTELVECDENRKKPINIEGSNYNLKTDFVIMALGSEPEDYMKNSNLELDEKGYIKIFERNQTSNPKIFAGGDIIGNKKTVACAARSGRDAAYQIIEYLNK